MKRRIKILVITSIGITSTILLYSLFINFYSLFINFKASRSVSLLMIHLEKAQTQYYHNPSLTGEDIVNMMNTQTVNTNFFGIPLEISVEIAGTPKKLSTIWPNGLSGKNKRVPIFWEKSPQYFNSYLVLFSSGYEYRIPKNIFDQYLQNQNEEYEFSFFNYNKLYGSKKDVLDHVRWKYFGYELNWEEIAEEIAL